MTEALPLVLVHVGPNFPDYMLDCIRQIHTVSTMVVHVLTERIHIQRITDAFPTVRVQAIEDIPRSQFTKQFESSSRLDTGFRAGFWKFTTARFFYIYEYARSIGLKDIFHMEYDNLLYQPIETQIRMFRTRSMWAVFDAPNRCIPSLLYWADASKLEPMLALIVATSARGLNDMQSLAVYRANAPAAVGCLPILDRSASVIPEMFTEHAAAFLMVFDGAACGQYVGGVDPRNMPGDTCGFINETCVFRCDKERFEWRTDGALRRPYLNGVPLANLHIHSKDLARWMSTVEY